MGLEPSHSQLCELCTACQAPPLKWVTVSWIHWVQPWRGDLFAQGLQERPEPLAAYTTCLVPHSRCLWKLQPGEDAEGCTPFQSVPREQESGTLFKSLKEVIIPSSFSLSFPPACHHCYPHGVTLVNSTASKGRGLGSNLAGFGSLCGDTRSISHSVLRGLVCPVGRHWRTRRI